MRKTWVIILILALLVPTPIKADENKVFTADYAKRVGGDIASLPTTVGRWAARHWMLTGGILALTVAAHTLDQEIGRAHV